MLSLEQIESGSRVTHKNTGFRYTVVDLGEDEVLLSPESQDLQDLVVPVSLFQQEFVTTERYSAPRSRSRRGPINGGARRVPAGPKCRGRIKKMVRERGFGFIRGEDGKEVFFHRSGMSSGDYDVLEEGDVVEYVVQESPRGPRAENVRAIGEQTVQAGT